MRTNLVWAGVVVGLIQLVLVQARGSDPKWDPVTKEELAEEKALIEPEAAAEALTERLEITDRTSGGRDILRRVRFKIYDAARATDVTRIARFWNNQVNPDHKIAVRLTLPNGSTRLFDTQDFKARNIAEEGRANGFLGFLGSRGDWSFEERFLAIGGVVKGSVLDIWEWEPHVEQTLWMMNTIQRDNVPIRHFEYMSRHPVDSKMIRRAYVLQPNGGKLTRDDKNGIIKFTVDNLPSTSWEPLAPPASYRSLTIVEAGEETEDHLSSRSFKIPTPKAVSTALGPWAFYSTEQDFYDADHGYATKRVKQKASELVAGATTEREKARRIYEFVQSVHQRFRSRADLENWYTRYIESVDELIDLDKIDSTVIVEDDFYYLFIALARSVGLECHSVFHPDRSDFRFTPDMVARRFVYYRTVAVRADGNWVICEPCSVVPFAFGTVPWYIEGQLALLAMPHQQAFLTIPSAPAQSSLKEFIGDLTLETDGTISGECVREFHGHAAELVRRRLHDTVQEHWWNILPSILELENATIELQLRGVDGFEQIEKPLRVRAFIRWPSYAALSQSRLLLTPCATHQGEGPLLNATRRTTPVFFQFPSVVKDTLTIKLPGGYRPEKLPAEMRAEKDSFSYLYSLTYDNPTNALKLQRESVNNAIEIPVEAYPTARDWFRRVAAADQTTIVVTSAVQTAAK